MKKFLSVVLTIAMIIGTMGVVSVGATEVLTANVVFDNINVTSDEGPAYAIYEGSVTIELVGDNYVEGGRGSAGIYVAPGATVTFIGSGSLTAVGGNADEFKPDSRNYPNLWNMYSAGAGIGGNGCSYIRNRDFVGGKLTTYYDELKTPSFGTIVISLDETGKISATGGAAVTNQGSGAGIGAGGSNPIVHQSEGSDEYDISFEGEIVINSGIIEAVGGTSPNPQSASAGAGIGAGCCSQAGVGNDIDITITGGDITAIGAADSAAIGGGAHVEGGDITITGGNVVAVSGEGSQSGNGAGIGAGHMMYDGIISIKGDAVVSATAKGDAAGIGAGADTGTGSESTDELHNENVIFGGNADISFDGGKTTFFTVEAGSTPSFKSDSAVCAIVDNNGTTIGLASSFDEAVSVINEFDNVTTLQLIKDTPVDKTVVIVDDIIIDGAGYTLKGADYPQVAEWDDAGVTPIKVDGATVTLKNITVEGGATANNAEFANLNSYGIAGDGIVAVNGAVVNIIDSTVKGGASDAEYTRGAGSAIVTTESTVQATNSVLESGALNTPNTIGEAVIETDEASVIVLKDVTLNAPKSGFANANVIEIYNGEDTAYDVVKEVTMSGVIYIPGARLKKVNIVTPEGEILILKGNIDSNMIAEEVEVVFEKVDQDVADEEQSDLYNIVLKSTQDMVYKNEDTGELISLNRKRFINRLNSLDLTFGLDHDADDIDYEIIESNEDIRINNVNNLKDRFEFHYKDKDGAYDTADTIILGQVKVSGYGEYEFFVDTNANSTNVAHATTSSDNIVNTFLPYGDITAGEGKLKIDESTTGVIRNVVPTKNLTIHVDFPNAVNDNVIAYQDMKVTVSGEDVDDIVIDLGEDAVETSIATANRGNAKYEAKFVDGAYVVNVTDALTINTSYDITVEGAGYRTARYTVRMTDNKTINFWNNVKDADADMEAGKFQAKKNFLAGDIVKDNNINVYDLSAVVSYFGETGLSENNHPEYAKYDLNRDGFIDSKDVAMVLVSWAE